MMGLVEVPDAAAICAHAAVALPASLPLEFHGTGFEVSATSEEAIARLRRVNWYFRCPAIPSAVRRMIVLEHGSEAHMALSRELRPSRGERRLPGHLLVAEWFPWAISIADSGLVHYYSSKMLRLAVVDALRATYVTLHAASLVAPGGGGLLLVGEAASGKTSLTLRLLDHGFRYCADDTSCIARDDVACVPFPMSFIIRADLKTGRPNVAELAGKPPDIELLDEPRWLLDRWDAVGQMFQPTHLIFLGAASLPPGDTRPVNPANAALRLLANVVVPLGADPESEVGSLEDLDVACRLAESVDSHEANSTDLDAVLGWILGLFSIDQGQQKEQPE